VSVPAWWPAGPARVPRPRSAARARTAATRIPGGSTRWIYEIYRAAFRDSDGDGVGDLNGRPRSGLDYLEALGVDAIWIGTDVSLAPGRFSAMTSPDYPDRGSEVRSLADFDHLLAEGRGKTSHPAYCSTWCSTTPSDQHHWFLEAAALARLRRTMLLLLDDGMAGPAASPCRPNNWGESVRRLGPGSTCRAVQFYTTCSTGTAGILTGVIQGRARHFFRRDALSGWIAAFGRFPVSRPLTPALFEVCQLRGWTRHSAGTNPGDPPQRTSTHTFPRFTTYPAAAGR